jgi:N6-adenosine-specific RNA methylase IME4
MDYSDRKPVPEEAVHHRAGGGSVRGVDGMSLAEIAALPVGDIAADDSVLFLWALPAMLPQALEVVSAWGFTFKTSAVWVKRGIACGLWFRGQHEPLLVATRGTMPPPGHLHASVFEGTTSGAHSEKPEAVRNWIAEAYPEAGKIELFARTAAPGWTAWGNQAPGPAEPGNPLRSHTNSSNRRLYAPMCVA